jgi:histidinol phosphatase-like PHP family hydrolase
MIDLHTHTLFSDGELLPSELVRRMAALGYEAVGLADHVDASNLDFVIPRLVKVSEDLNLGQSVRVVPGVELTHVPPAQIGGLVAKARTLGAKIVVLHGETVVEPVAPGTNRAGLEAGVDVLAHPGLITAEDAAMAARKGILLEISGRSGHSFSNGHVAKMAREAGAGLVLNSDAHAPRDLMTEDFGRRVVEGAGLGKGAHSELLQNARRLLEKIGCAR